MLCGLFVYDVFWVFGTEVMVSVAKGLDAPIKILFPKALGVKPLPVSMLGLGDVVMPGLLLCFVMRYDAYKRAQVLVVIWLLLVVTMATMVLIIVVLRIEKELK